MTAELQGHALYKTSLTKRRTRQNIDQLCADMYGILRRDHPMTVRQVFYRMVSAGLIDKSEGEYKNTVCRLLAKMRRAGELPFGWIADNTRWVRKPKTYSSLAGMLELTAETYRRALWADQDAYVEIWLEKDALAGVLWQVTQAWDVPLMVTRGYPSLTYLYDAAETIADIGKPTYIYYLGDWDPSGLDISYKVEDGLLEFAPDADIAFERVAVTPEQVRQWQLPTRPTKKSDSRSKGFRGESVEVDAIPPSHLRSLVETLIQKHVDGHAYAQTKRIESEERHTFELVLKTWRGMEGAM